MHDSVQHHVHQNYESEHRFVDIKVLVNSKKTFAENVFTFRSSKM